MTPNAAISGRRRLAVFSAEAEKVTGKEVRFITLLGVNSLESKLMDDPLRYVSCFKS